MPTERCAPAHARPFRSAAPYAALTLSWLFGAACGAATEASSPVGPIVSLDVSPQTIAVPLTAARQLTASAKDAQGRTVSGRVFAWKSSDPNVATVSPDGLVRGIGVGSATITAMTDQMSGVAAVTVRFSLIKVTTGTSHTCGLAESGTAFCWGYSGFVGSTGDSTTLGRYAPRQVAGINQFTAVDAGGYHTCGIAGPVVYCWGDNTYGQLGDGTTTGRTLPTPVATTTALTSISAGDTHTCGLTSTGAAYCWGVNVAGELGDGTFTDRSVPTRVSGGLSFTSIYAGYTYTCGLTTNGTAYCWGIGPLFVDIGGPSPEVVPGQSFRKLSIGMNHMCGIALDGTALCWGSNADGTLGDGTLTPRARPTAVVGGFTFSDIDAGRNHTCGLTTAGAAVCWGREEHGELGDGKLISAPRPTPEFVSGGLTFIGITATWRHTCALAADGIPYCWGDGFWGVLGNGTSDDRAAPTLVRNP